MSHEWYCRLDAHELGPLSAAALRELARSGCLRPEHHVRRGSQGAWVVARRVRNLFRLGLRWPAPLGFLDPLVPGPTPLAWRMACTLGLLSITAGYWSATRNFVPSQPLLTKRSTSPQGIPAPAITKAAPVPVPPAALVQAPPVVPVAVTRPVAMVPSVANPTPPPTPTPVAAATPPVPLASPRKGGLLDSAELVRVRAPESKSRLFDSSAVSKGPTPATTPQPQ